MGRNKVVLSLLLLLLTTLFTTSMAQKSNGRGLYAFGYATCLGDSVAYITGIQYLDSATVNKKTGFMEHREYYARQMEKALASQYVGKHYTCALFFSKDKSKLEKQYTDLRKSLNRDKGVVVDEKAVATFRFVPVVER